MCLITFAQVLIRKTEYFMAFLKEKTVFAEVF